MNACCGLNCKECPAFRATQNEDDEARKKVAEKWSRLFGLALTAADINCDGCLSGSTRMFMHCRQCAIRSCSQTRGLKSCAACDDYVCPTLNGFLSLMPAAKEGLENLRRQMSK